MGSSIITVLDTSVGSCNGGDEIIMQAVQKHLEDVFPEAHICRGFTHFYNSWPSYQLFRMSRFRFVGGTNLLSSHMLRYKQWKINLIDRVLLKKVILMGVGWWQYQGKPDLYTQYLLSHILDPEATHSVRDSYTREMLADIGIHNVVVTGCPTIWDLSDDHCSRIPRDKAQSVVFTLTDYSRDPRMDRKFVNTLFELYESVYFWPQGTGDSEYLESLGASGKIHRVLPHLSSYENFLKNKLDQLEYVGTRLHAGIRAMQAGRRTVIIGIDNRAVEMGLDFGIPVCQRSNLGELPEMLNTPFSTRIRVPVQTIRCWKEQFT